MILLKSVWLQKGSRQPSCSSALWNKWLKEYIANTKTESTKTKFSNEFFVYNMKFFKKIEHLSGSKFFLTPFVFVFTSSLYNKWEQNRGALGYIDIN